MQFFDSLLPPNSTQLERDLEQVIANAIDIEVHIQDLWDPYKCPFKLLPWLAWAYSVDHWEDSWPEHIKRDVVANSFEIHQHKGTPYALQRALDSLGIRTNMLEWWEANANGQPGTMKILAMLTENFTSDKSTLFTKEMLDMITEAIRVHKRGSIHFELELGIAFEESAALFSVADYGVGVTDFTAQPIPLLPDRLTGSINTYGVCHQTHLSDYQAKFSAAEPYPTQSDLKLGVVANQLIFSEITLNGAA